MSDIIWLSDSQILSKTGEKLKEWRLENDFSQAEAARKADLSLLTYQKFEYGKGGSLKYFLKILRILGHLDLLEPLMEEKKLSPIEYQKYEQGLKHKKRASKTKMP